MLGVGTAVTLAAWNDAEHGTATITAGRFGIVGATDGVTFSEHPSAASAATLAFSAPVGAMAPGRTSYALFSVRTLDPSVAGTAQLVAASTNGAGLGQYLRYGVRSIAGTTCDAASFAAGTVIVPTDSALTASAAGAQPLQANAGSTLHYCLAITLPATTPNAAQGQSVTASWEVVATSS